ncbi:fimbrial protein [Advenella mimigardefordensis]|uniref:Putative fimbrial protein n=1 Tax=Advenella mimigardefordensis (strain DSM 17166 / LMG 22922 / DPN7) TaxID=1247726 RepID=W0PIJ2_ADVMD|nr:fimbrial protein [Advenella mimigardefordensis]AHG64763.1 putative fimbrial protein [Advenella mimigardefordensis DPN7]
MKFQKLFLAVIAAAGCASAFAFDGTINITGKVTDQTCQVKTGTEQLSVRLPDVGAASLNVANKTAGATRFTIKLENCSPGNGNVLAYFEPGTTIIGSRLKNTSTSNAAGNVEVQLLNNNHQPIDLSQNSASAQSSTSAPVNSTEISLDYYARYFATAAATPGEVTSTVNYTVVYN